MSQLLAIVCSDLPADVAELVNVGVGVALEVARAGASPLEVGEGVAGAKALFWLAIVPATTIAPKNSTPTMRSTSGDRGAWRASRIFDR
jgi:hypothetical protein